MSYPDNYLLLINPWIYDFAAYDYWLKPLGLLSIAALLRENGFKLSFIDCLDRYNPFMLSRINGKKIRDNKKFGHGQFFKEEIQKPKQLTSIPRRYSRYGIHPDIFLYELKRLPYVPAAVLITTMMTYWYSGTAQALTIIRKIFPGTPVILGGNYVTLCPSHARTLGADYYVHGDGKLQIMAILNKITNRSFQCSTAIKTPTNKADKNDLDILPYPAFDLLNHFDYVCLQTSRGCPFRCSYCASGLLEQVFKRMSPERVVNEIEYWYREYGIKNFAFYDDALLFKTNEHIVPILKGIIKNKLNNINFHTPNGLHARFINAELANLMFKTGFKTIRLGYETADPQMQNSTGAKVNDENLIAALSYLNEAGFTTPEIGVYVMIGMPGQEAKEVEESIEKVIKFGGTPVLTEFSPIPGTKIWNEALRYSKYDLSNDPIYHNNSIFPCEWSGFTWEDFLRIKSMVNERRIRL